LGVKLIPGPYPLLKCSRCTYTWVPRREEPPKRCPRCRSIKWDMPELTVTCTRCNHTWNSHNGSPKRCPECGSHQWNVPPNSYTCKRCNETWVVKGSRVPKRCPSCSSRDWNLDNSSSDGKVDRNENALDEEKFKRVIECYRHGMSCVEISIEMGIPYNLVYTAVRSHIPNRDIKV